MQKMYTFGGLVEKTLFLKKIFYKQGVRKGSRVGVCRQAVNAASLQPRHSQRAH